MLKAGLKDGELTGIGRIIFYNVKIMVPEREGTFITKQPQTFLGVYEGEIYCGQPQGFGRFISSAQFDSGHFHMGKYTKPNNGLFKPGMFIL